MVPCCRMSHSFFLVTRFFLRFVHVGQARTERHWPCVDIQREIPIIAYPHHTPRRRTYIDLFYLQTYVHMYFTYARA